jgi:hypothetical protein
MSDLELLVLTAAIIHAGGDGGPLDAGGEANGYSPDEAVRRAAAIIEAASYHIIEKERHRNWGEEQR